MAILLARSTAGPTTGPAAAAVSAPVVTPSTESVVSALWLVDTDVAAVRRAVADVMATDGGWSRVRSLDGGRLRPVVPAEAVLWADQMVTTSAHLGGDPARVQALLATPLARSPFVVVVAPDAVVMRWRREVGGQRDALRLLWHLVRAATKERPRRVPRGRQTR